MKARIYIDTSIVGGYFDDEFYADTQALFKRLQDKEIAFIVSSVLQQELLKAPANVRDLLGKYDARCFEYIELTEEAIELADKYIAEKVVGKTSANDCRHIALATIYKADALASWNFKHIVNLNKIKLFNSVNLREGYSILDIRTPQEVLLNDEE